jgi:hypothetical protein
MPDWLSTGKTGRITLKVRTDPFADSLLIKDQLGGKK